MTPLRTTSKATAHKALKDSPSYALMKSDCAPVTIKRVECEKVNVTLVTLRIVEDLMRVRLTRCAGRPGPRRTSKGPKCLTWRHGVSRGSGEVPHSWRPVRGQGTEVPGDPECRTRSNRGCPKETVLFPDRKHMLQLSNY